MILAAQTRHKADAVQLQAAVRVLGQIPVTGAVESLLRPCSHTFGQIAQTHALEHGIGKQGGAAGFQIVALGLRVVDDLPEHPGLLVLELVHILHSLFEHSHDAAILVVQLLVHALQHIHHCHKEPAHGAQPEVGAAAGLRVCPIHLAALVVAVVVQATDRCPCARSYPPWCGAG